MGQQRFYSLKTQKRETSPWKCHLVPHSAIMVAILVGFFEVTTFESSYVPQLDSWWDFRRGKTYSVDNGSSTSVSITLFTLRVLITAVPARKASKASGGKVKPEENLRNNVKDNNYCRDDNLDLQRDFQGQGNFSFPLIPTHGSSVSRMTNRFLH